MVHLYPVQHPVPPIRSPGHRGRLLGRGGQGLILLHHTGAGIHPKLNTTLVGNSQLAGQIDVSTVNIFFGLFA